MKVDGLTANIMVAIALAIATPFFVIFGGLSDKIGRKPIILLGCVLAAATYFPAFHALTDAANPALARAQASAPVTVEADPAQCSIQFDPVGRNKFDTTGCDIAKNYLVKAAVNFKTVPITGSRVTVHIGSEPLQKSRDGVSGFDEGIAHQGWLSRQGRSRSDEQAYDYCHLGLPRLAGDHGLWPDRRLVGRAVPEPHPLFGHVPALSYRQWLVWRILALYRLCHGRQRREYLFRPLLSGRHRRRHGGHRLCLSAGNLQARY